MNNKPQIWSGYQGAYKMAYRIMANLATKRVRKINLLKTTCYQIIVE
jgi:hypothetical protein